MTKYRFLINCNIANTLKTYRNNVSKPLTLFWHRRVNLCLSRKSVYSNNYFFKDFNFIKLNHCKVVGIWHKHCGIFKMHIPKCFRFNFVYFLVAQKGNNLPAIWETWVRKIPWRREWLLTPVFLPGEFHGQRSLTVYSPWSQRVRLNWATNTFTFSCYTELRV